MAHSLSRQHQDSHFGDGSYYTMLIAIPTSSTLLLMGVSLHIDLNYRGRSQHRRSAVEFWGRIPFVCCLYLCGEGRPAIRIRRNVTRQSRREAALHPPSKHQTTEVEGDLSGARGETIASDVQEGRFYLISSPWYSKTIRITLTLCQPQSTSARYWM